jgi:hypothetical protein
MFHPAAHQNEMRLKHVGGDFRACYNSLPHNDLLGHYELLAILQRNHRVMSVLGCAGSRTAVSD